MSRVLGDGRTHLSTNTYGTISYMAPELLSEGILSKPADVYSFGILSEFLHPSSGPFKSIQPLNSIPEVQNTEYDSIFAHLCTPLGLTSP